MLSKILIVESDRRFADQLVRYFESKGSHALVQTPESVLESAGRCKPDLVILSAEFASISLLRDLRLLPERPAILLTEEMSFYRRAWRAWQMGGDELLIKPVLKASQLADAVFEAMKNALTEPEPKPAWQVA